MTIRNIRDLAAFSLNMNLSPSGKFLTEAAIQAGANREVIEEWHRVVGAVANGVVENFSAEEWIAMNSFFAETAQMGAATAIAMESEEVLNAAVALAKVFGDAQWEECFHAHVAWTTSKFVKLSEAVAIDGAPF